MTSRPFRWVAAFAPSAALSTLLVCAGNAAAQQRAPAAEQHRSPAPVPVPAAVPGVEDGSATSATPVGPVEQGEVTPVEATSGQNTAGDSDGQGTHAAAQDPVPATALAPPRVTEEQPAMTAASPLPPRPTSTSAVPGAPAEPAREDSGHFFDHINVRGYTQFRHNQLLATNDRLVNFQGDRSVGQDAGVLVRRARLVLFGDLHPQVYMYLQTDFAASAGDTIHLGQIRDWYFDLALDPDEEFRFRVGQSKVPYGLENMQSSQNRLPMDRTDALNSAVAGERDLGVFFYYAPRAVRRLFKHLTDSGLKGSGDYGMVALGAYEGQTINQPDANRNKHVVGRVSYPFTAGSQILELGVQGYTGKYVVRTDAGITAPEEVRDARAAASFTLYPIPFGLQAEYNLGVGPELTGLTASTDAAGDTSYTGAVRREFLHGGYVLASLELDDVVLFARAHNYEGGKKHERNAPRYSVRELEGGAEWQIIKALEVTAGYTIARRSDGRIPYGRESGRLLRLQLQVNY